MGRTRTTRQGTGKPASGIPARGGPAAGAGWGGEAKGAGKPPGNREAGRRDAAGAYVPTGEGKREEARRRLEDAVPLAIDTVIAIAGKLDDQRALAAAQSILNRTGFHEKSGLEHSAPDGPLIVERVFVGGKAGHDA